MLSKISPRGRNRILLRRPGRRARCDEFDRSRRVTTRPWSVDDDLWARIEPLLPPWPERSPGLKPVDDRLCLEGILYVLHQDVAWQLLLLALGFGPGQTCWQKAGVLEQLHRIPLAELHAAEGRTMIELRAHTPERGDLYQALDANCHGCAGHSP
ncbi:transposase [Streptomyces krungchingensis]|uniref:transposase n=1 Tax=Streptomyces krungchingensis TaxID=1565034 RepID=UPI003CE6C180